MAMVIFHGFVVSQSILTGDLHFTDQIQIEDFQKSFPECTTIDGNVTISGPLVFTLEGLSGLTAIEGTLRVGAETSIINFLSDLSGLDKLSRIGGDLEIINNGALESLSGLDRLTSVAGGIHIENNLSLVSLTGLRNLVWTGGSMEIVNNRLLTDLTGLERLSEIKGHLVIAKNPGLLDLQGPGRLRTVKGNLEVTSNPVLLSMRGLEALIQLGDSLLIENNPSLASLAGIENIDLGTVKCLYVWNNQNLATCEVKSICDYLSAPTGTVEIYNNAEGCDNPPQVARKAGFPLPCLPHGPYYFYSQSDIDRFKENYPGCHSLGGNVFISGKDITHLDGLNDVTSIRGSLIIFDNDMLTGLGGLENLTYIGDGLYLGENDLFQDLSGLENLHHIGEFLEIDFNEELASLQGLEGLSTVGKGIHLEGNRHLVNVTGLENIDTHNLEFFIIANNFRLSSCQTESVCEFLDLQGHKMHVFNNGSGCEDIREVTEACEAAALQPLQFAGELRNDF